MAEPRDFLLPADHALFGLRPRALLVGGVGAALSAIGALFDAGQFTRSYLVAYMFWLGVGLGSMGILMLHHITGGRWGAVLRRALEAATRTLPLLALLFVPLLLGMGELYDWSHAEIVAHDPILQHKSVYLNVPFFVVRVVVYFGIWITVATLLSRWSLEQDGGHTARIGQRMHFLSRGGMLLYAATMTFASIDWVMSIEPHWFSHIYGVIFTGGQILTAMAFMIPIAAMMAGAQPFAHVLSHERFHDLGKLLLAFIMLWAYFALSQYLIIWSGNLPEETPWYIDRLAGGWQHVGTLLIVFHFAVPFVVLLSRAVKTNPNALAVVALTLLAFRYIDLYWLIVPSFSPRAFTFHWLDVMTFAAIGGLWVWFFLGQLGNRPVVPVYEPILAEEMPA